MKSIIVVAAIIWDGACIFFHPARVCDWKDYLEFPGGKIEDGETPKEAPAREIREELGAEIAIEAYLTTAIYDYPEFHLHILCYLTRV